MPKKSRQTILKPTEQDGYECCACGEFYYGPGAKQKAQRCEDLDLTVKCLICGVTWTEDIEVVAPNGTDKHNKGPHRGMCGICSEKIDHGEIGERTQVGTLITAHDGRRVMRLILPKEN